MFCLFITVAVENYDCDFETDDCKWNININSTDEYKWKRKSALVYSPSTGPNWDHTTGSCMFVTSQKHRHFYNLY